ncbi:unnamed protein product, partial [marine sediment metagenome]
IVQTFLSIVKTVWMNFNINVKNNVGNNNIKNGCI